MGESNEQYASPESATSEAAGGEQAPPSSPGEADLTAHVFATDAMDIGAQPDDNGAGRLSEDELALLDAFHRSALAPAHWSAFRTPQMADGMADLDEIPIELKRTCIVEAVEDLEFLRAQAHRLERQPNDLAPVAEMGRIAHKIRGSASTFGLDLLAELTSQFEDTLKAVRTSRVPQGLTAASALTGMLDLMGRALSMAAADEAPDPGLLLEGSRLREQLLAHLAASPDVQTTPPASQHEPALTWPSDTDTHPGLPLAMQLQAALRVDPRRLERLMDDASSLPLSRAVLAQLRDEIARLQADLDQAVTRLGPLGRQLSDLYPANRAATIYAAGDTAGTSAWNTSALSQAASLRADTDPNRADAGSTPRWGGFALEQYTDFDHLSRALAEAIEDVTSTGRTLASKLTLLTQGMDEQASIARAIQHAVVHLRLVPLSGIVERLQLEVHRLAALTGKSVAFSARGEMTELDRAISAELTDPLVQLVRNAVVHGIESPEERREAGKPPAGSIWLHASYIGSDVVIELGDDGYGANPHQLIALAKTAGVLDAETARSFTPSEALDLMFVPGLTAFQKPSVVSGQGIGLDQVRTTIERLKGSVQVRSEVGAGTVFRIRVPISLSVVKALHIRAGGQDYAVPFSSVQRTLALSPMELLVSDVPDGSGAGMSGRVALRIRIEPAASSTPLIQPLPAEHRLEEIPAYPLAELLGFPQERRNPQLAIVVQHGRWRVALLVDDILSDYEVVVQRLPAHLRRRVVRGATVTSEGRLLLVLDVYELVGTVLDGGRLPSVLRTPILPPQPRPVAPRVLVVDDSVSIRHALDMALTRAGFEVQVARDGVEALEMMLASPPAVLLLDIEMPRLDGFELLTILRGSAQFDGVRVVMLTSRTGATLREHALQLGAAAYLTKPCPQETIVETVRTQLAQSAAGQ